MSNFLNLHTNSMDGNGNIIGMGMFFDWSPSTSETLSTYYVSGITTVQLKMFVPPGTLAVTVTYNCQYNTMFLDDIFDSGVMAVCWGSEILDAPEYMPPSTYTGDLTKGWTATVTQDGTNMAVILRAGETAITEGEWLYIWVVNYDGDTSHKQYINSYVTIDKEVYAGWYYKASWDEDGNPTSYGITPTVPVVTYTDPYIEALKLDPNAEYPQPWDIREQYPFTKPFPWPFGE
jgi:hypothetical protein